MISIDVTEHKPGNVLLLDQIMLTSKNDIPQTRLNTQTLLTPNYQHKQLRTSVNYKI